MPMSRRSYGGKSVKNLVAPSTLPEVWSRHTSTAPSSFPLIDERRRLGRSGSGAGFPGMVLAILAAEQGGLPTHLIESNSRKAAFLMEVALADSSVPVTVYPARAEAVLPASRLAESGGHRSRARAARRSLVSGRAAA